MILQSMPAIIMASITFFVGVSHLVIYLRQPQRRENLTFAATSLGASLYDAFCARLYSVGSVAEGIPWQRAQVSVLSLALIALLWFVADYTGHRSRRLIWVLTVYGVFAAAFGLFDQSGLAWLVDQPSTKVIPLALGLTVTYYEATPGPLVDLQSVVGWFGVVYCLWMAITALKRGPKARMRPLLIALLLLLTSILSDTAVSTGLYLFVYTIEYGFLGLLMVMEFAIIGGVVEGAKVKEALQESEERFRRLMENLPDVVYRFRIVPTPAYEYISPAITRLIGYTPEDHYANPALGLDLIIPEDRPSLQTITDSAFSLKDPLTLRWLHRDGHVVWTEHRISPVNDASGNLVAVEGVIRDVTYRVRAEEALSQAVKMESLGILAGGVAHDFNNLLVAMLGQTSLALSSLPADHPARAAIEKAVAASQRAADLTRQMLAYSGRGHFQIQPVDLNALINENLHLFQAAVPKNVILQPRLNDALPLIAADPGQMQQVIMNLILNAADAIGPRPGLVQVSTAAEDIQPESDYTLPSNRTRIAPRPGRFVRLEVSDDGEGMDAATLSRIFDPFFTTKFTGRGLGLAAVLGIVRGHDGGLWVDSRPGAGTTFRIFLPAGVPAGLEPAQPEAPTQESAPLVGAAILVIDDEAPVREAVADILQAAGMHVYASPDGESGLALYREKEREIALVLLDLSMPGMGGADTLAALRRANPAVRVILSSGYNEVEATRRFTGKGLAGFIQKPYTSATLVREIRRHMRRDGCRPAQDEPYSA